MKMAVLILSLLSCCPASALPLPLPLPHGEQTLGNAAAPARTKDPQGAVNSDCQALPCEAPPTETEFVTNGVAQNVIFDGKNWTTTGGSLVGSGVGNILRGGQKLGAGDFTLQAELTIRKLAKSAASLVLNDSHFGFEGGAGEMFTEGSLFGRQNLGAPVVKEGVPFVVAAKRRGNQLTIDINGQTVVRSEFGADTPVTVGLRPWRSTMLVHRFAAGGNLIDAPKPPPHTTVFERGQGGYHTYRIPAIVATKAGTLLAFCEGRREGRGDAGNIDLLVKRSTDNGRSWSESQVIWDDDDNTCGNPAPVVDQQTGTIWLPMTWNLGTDHENEIMAGNSEQPRHVYLTHSRDDGVTWATPIKISDVTRKAHWRWYATGPGNSIQLTRGPHKGRLLIPANHSDHSMVNKHPYRSHVFWSDDHGRTWQLGGIHGEKTNESAVVELGDGSVMQAMRSYHGKNRRALSVSRDGGATWGEDYLHEALDTPVCQASILRYSFSDEESSGGRSRILFSSPLGSRRSDLHVWCSYDEGKTWPVKKQIHSGGSAYSNLVRLTNGQIGVLYERDGYQTISLASFDLKWLESN